MTYDFFKKHSAEFLTDEAIDKLWHESAWGPGMYLVLADEPEDTEQALLTRTTAMMFALIYPDTARVTEAA